MTELSLVTLVRGRKTHLHRMLEAALSADDPPGEIVVALMQEDEPELPGALSARVRFVPVPGGKLPLARARNEAVRRSTGRDLVFLDVDCIPSPGFFRAAREELGDTNVLMGVCRYLGPEAPFGRGFEALWGAAQPHPARPDPEPEKPVFKLATMTELWSLTFSLRRSLFERAGGFDERFIGYGGEDTDFALGLENTGASLLVVPGMRAVHQWHPVRIPPLQHFDDIIANARRFREKHGQWCMDYWLGQLEEQGYIRWTEERIEVRKVPSGDDLEAARQPASIRFS